MRGIVSWGGVCIFASCSLGQLADSEVHYYTYANVSHTMLILASADSRVGSGFSFAFGKKDPRLTVYHRIPGELILETSFNRSTTNKPTVQHPDRTNQSLSIFATARYRWPKHGAVNFYGDGGLGFAIHRHSSTDLPLANNFMIGGGIGAEFSAGDNSSFLLGTRYIHTSNAGRKRPNFGENQMQYYVGYSWKK